jgi:hypothetical protein
MTGAAQGPMRPEPSSVVDPIGRVLHREGRILRGIRAQFADEYRVIVREAESRGWFERGLVRTWIAPDATPEFPLVLEHERVTFVTHRGEWPAAALRRAALCYLDLSIALVDAGYCLKDAHTWNVLFEGPRPVVIDLGSLRPIAELWWPAWVAEFEKYFLVPLWLFAAGKAGLARAMLREQAIGAGFWLLDHDPRALLPDRPEVPADRFTPRENLEALAEHVASLTFRHPAGEWTSYPQPAGSAELRGKDLLVASLLESLPRGTVLDLGTNRGLHAFMAAPSSTAVLAADIDEACLDQVYDRARDTATRVQPVYLDLVWPIGSSGAFDTLPSARERLRCDLVLALALTHHICVRQRFDPEVFVAGVAAYTRDAAVIEFVPEDDWHVRQWDLPPLAGYSAAAFEQACRRHFADVERIASDPAPREIFVCRGRRT